jgi:peroxiredoxin
MHFIILLLRIGLSAVFSTAAVTKLIDQRGTREAVTNFGAPASLAPTIAVLLPIAELGIAVGLWFSRTTAGSALGAMVVLLIFIVAIGVNLARGRTHDCHCFGQLYSRPLGWPTLLRNFIFAAVASFIWWQPPVSVESSNTTGALAPFISSPWLLAIFVLLITGAALAYGRRQQAKAALEASHGPKGLPIDSPAPDFELPAYAGGTISLRQLLAPGKPLLLVFTNPNCSPCVALFAEIKDWQQAHSDRLTIALISFGTVKENFVNVARNGLGTVLLQQKREVAESYGGVLTPTAVIVSREGRIASKLAAGAEEIRELLGTIVGPVQTAHRHGHVHQPKTAGVH